MLTVLSRTANLIPKILRMAIGSFFAEDECNACLKLQYFKRSLNGLNNLATMHVVVSGGFSEIKHQIRTAMRDRGIAHITIELQNRE